MNAGKSRPIDDRLLHRPSQQIARVRATRFAPPGELDRIDPPISRLATMDDGVVQRHIQRQLALSLPGQFPYLAQQNAQPSVGQVVLGARFPACCHRRNTLNCARLAASSATHEPKRRFHAATFIQS